MSWQDSILAGEGPNSCFDPLRADGTYVFIDATIFQDGDTNFIRDTLADRRSLLSWVKAKFSWRDSAGSLREEIRSSFKLLVYLDSRAQNDPEGLLPFESAAQMAQILNSLGAPAHYSIIMKRKYMHPLTTCETSSGDVQFMCQSPSLQADVHSMALRFQPSQHSVTGFLYVHNNLDRMLDDLRMMMHHIGHPLLLPILLYKEYAIITENARNRAQDDLRIIEHATGFLADPMHALDRAEGAEPGQTPNSFQTTHRSIVEAHSDLNSAMSDYAQSFGNQLRAARGRIAQLLSRSSLREETRTELDNLADIIDAQAAEYPDTKKRLLARLDLQLQVLYNLMQQDIAKQAQADNEIMKELSTKASKDSKIVLRDSARMKSIAVLTMVYLPATALAAIFSMSPFFSLDADNRLWVSEDFWVFWAVTAPVTLLTVLSYAVWTQRKELKLWWNPALVEDVAPEARDPASRTPSLAVRDLEQGPENNSDEYLPENGPGPAARAPNRSEDRVGMRLLVRPNQARQAQ